LLLYVHERARSGTKQHVTSKIEAARMGFPGTWMTSSESVVYRVVPKCACSTIGQIMYYSDNGAFFDGDIHDAKDGMHKWAFEAASR
jgi:hypothetical protein